MKKALPLLLLAIVFTGPRRSHAQWCVPTTADPYSTDMPGLTRVTVGSIDRISLDLENFPNNSYVNTGLSTTFTKGQVYPITLQFTIDAAIADHMNLRVWIDLNQDGQLDDPGETLLSVDHVVGSYSATLNIPLSATTGTTRMRVTAKMCSHGGHTLPTPCDIPADPLGYHGEIEDYDVTIAEPSAIIEHFGAIDRALVAPLPLDASSALLITTNAAAALELEVLDANGRVISSVHLELPAGDHRLPLTFHSALTEGAYLLRLRTSDGARTIRLVKAGS